MPLPFRNATKDKLNVCCGVKIVKVGQLLRVLYLVLKLVENLNKLK